MNTSFSILVNTTDSFEDCWEPFFTLFAKYWPEYSGKIYLNTEYKSYSFPGLHIIPVKNHRENAGSKLTWSECLVKALDTIEEDIILYMQEDYFMQAPVHHEEVVKYAALLSDTPIDCLHITPASGGGPFLPSPYPGLRTIGPKAHCRLSCQAAFWKKNIIYKYIRLHETPWQFETFGTMRSYILKDNFFTVDVEELKKNEIFPYLRTGVIQGKWKKDVVALFKQNGIENDFSKRGFYERKIPGMRTRIQKKIQRFPKEFRNQIDLLRLRLSH